MGSNIRIRPVPIGLIDGSQNRLVINILYHTFAGTIIVINNKIGNSISNNGNSMYFILFCRFQYCYKMNSSYLIPADVDYVHCVVTSRGHRKPN